MPVNFLCWLNSKFDPPAVHYVYADPTSRSLKSIVGQSSGDSAVTTAFSVGFEADISVLERCEIGPCAIAVVAETHVTTLLSSKGEALFHIGFDGSVVDVVQEAAKPVRRRRSYIRTEAPSVFGVQLPTACAVAVCESSRIVAIGYVSGIDLLWDLATKRVFKRIIAHTSPVVKIFSFPAQARIVSTAMNGAVRLDVIHARALRDIRNSASATPTAEGLDVQRSRSITPLQMT
jgi:hypothetical protein